MSNNIWNCGDNKPWWEENGFDCSAEARAPGFCRVYSETLPDVIGLQESSPKVLDNLMQCLEATSLPYAMLWGRFTSIIYRTDKLELIDSEHHINPDNIDGFEGVFNDKRSKSYCMALFRTKEDGKKLIFATTHLWWKSSDPSRKSYQPHSDEARERQLSSLIDRVDEFRKKYDCPAVVVGDLNTKRSSTAIKTAIEREYIHAYDLATEHRDERDGYHYCFPDGFDRYEAPKSADHAIDHALVAGAPNGFVRTFERFTPDYYMPLSDHFPLYIDVEL